jgi:beta-lactamase class D
MKIRFFIPVIISVLLFPSPANSAILEKAISDAMAGQRGVCVFMDCGSGETVFFDSTGAGQRLTPCSTFKIWNTLIGVECNLVSSPDELFYTWDGESRFIPEWNKNQTLREAFQVSCVPAFQNLATRIGPEKMQKWLDSIRYGDRDISSGIDIFWLPREGKKSIRISPLEQTTLIRQLVTGKLPFSDKATKVLKEVMIVKKTPTGTVFGKTGTGYKGSGDFKQNIGWFVGYVEGNKKTYSFACVVKGENVTGKNAREVIETVLFKSGLL